MFRDTDSDEKKLLDDISDDDHSSEEYFFSCCWFKLKWVTTKKRALLEKILDSFTSQNREELNAFLQSDSFSSDSDSEHIFSWDDSIDSDDSLDDEDLIMFIYEQIQEMTFKNPKIKHEHYFFAEDDVAVKKLHDFFSCYVQLIPKDITLHLSTKGKIFSPISGVGQSNPSYEKAIQHCRMQLSDGVWRLVKQDYYSFSESNRKKIDKLHKDFSSQTELIPNDVILYLSTEEHVYLPIRGTGQPTLSYDNKIKSAHQHPLSRRTRYAVEKLKITGLSAGEDDLCFGDALRERPQFLALLASDAIVHCPFFAAIKKTNQYLSRRSQETSFYLSHFCGVYSGRDYFLRRNSWLTVLTHIEKVLSNAKYISEFCQYLDKEIEKFNGGKRHDYADCLQQLKNTITTIYGAKELRGLILPHVKEYQNLYHTMNAYRDAGIKTQANAPFPGMKPAPELVDKIQDKFNLYKILYYQVDRNDRGDFLPPAVEKLSEIDNFNADSPPSYRRPRRH